jgi:predicted helicase
MHSASDPGAAGESIDPSARKERGPQDDKGVFRALVAAGKRLAEIHVHYEQQPEYRSSRERRKAKSSTIASTKCG